MTASPQRIVNVHEAKTHFSRLIDAAHAGETIVVAKGGKHWSRLAALRVLADRWQTGARCGPTAGFDHPGRRRICGHGSSNQFSSCNPSNTSKSLMLRVTSLLGRARPLQAGPSRPHLAAGAWAPRAHWYPAARSPQLHLAAHRAIAPGLDLQIAGPVVPML